VKPKRLRMLVRMWNAQAMEPLDAEELLRRAPTSGVRRYRELLENVITGDAPFAELAFEYEIENLSLMLGPCAPQQSDAVCHLGARRCRC
jgi:hypothetical protein